ncbi:aldehyde dehydrogenase family-domain-containing protein [Mycena floridula]|nr:aldehyde dehydrogenase family-domain-containing protein [Mycena floridula]
MIHHNLDRPRRGIGYYRVDCSGDPFSPESRFGPLASRAQFDRVQEYIESGKSQGGSIHSGGERSGNEGYFIQPTIFTNCTPDMKIVREEIFGPVSVITKFSTEQEVLEMANNTTYGLACGVFTQNGSRAIRAAHGLEADVAFVNCYNEVQKHVLFGGFQAIRYRPRIWTSWVGSVYSDQVCNHQLGNGNLRNLVV